VTNNQLINSLINIKLLYRQLVVKIEKSIMESAYEYVNQHNRE